LFYLFYSSNLSKAAWGFFDYKNNFNIISYELGVLFLKNESESEKSNFYDLSENEFLLPYDLPPNKYDSAGECSFFMLQRLI
jgi:hypothetical protein